MAAENDALPPKKCVCPEHQNHERWVISFADFMTLLFALFVVLYATSQADMKKLKRAKMSMGRAFGPSVGEGPAALPPAADDRDTEDQTHLEEWRYAPIFGRLSEDKPDPPQRDASLVALKRELDRALAATGLRGRASTKLGANGVVMAMTGEGMFLPGGAELVSGAPTVLGVLADYMKRHSSALVVEAAIASGQSELSAAREAALLNEFVAVRQVPRDLVVTIGRHEKGPARWGQGVRMRIMLIAWGS